LRTCDVKHTAKTIRIPDQRVRSGGDFHASAEEAELDVVHDGDAEGLTRGGVELRCERLVAGASDPWGLMTTHRLAADAHPPPLSQSLKREPLADQGGLGPVPEFRSSRKRARARARARKVENCFPLDGACAPWGSRWFDCN